MQQRRESKESGVREGRIGKIMSIAEFYIDYGIDPNEDVCEALRSQGHLPDHATTPKNSASKSRSKKRKAESPEPAGRTCCECNETKTPDSFSKNQRRKGSKARCSDCIQNS